MNTRIKLNEYGDIEYCYIWLAILHENACGSALKSSSLYPGIL